MSVRLPIVVADIALTLAAGYDYVKVYRSPKETGDFFEITTPSQRVPLETGVSNYEYIDYNGTTEHWYKVTFYDSTLPQESAYSTAFKGEFVDTSFHTPRYPEEGVYTSLDRLIIDRVRTLVGDRKELTRDYVSANGGYSSISEDGYSHAFSNPKGWPVSVSLDGVYYDSADEPQVNDSQFITFSGIQINTVSGTLDVWYYHFRFSDSEILRTYNGLTPPYPLEACQVTFDLAVLCTTIELLMEELNATGATSGVEVDIFEEIRINPKVGLDSRFGILSALMKQKKDLLDALIAGFADADIVGVLID